MMCARWSTGRRAAEFWSLPELLAIKDTLISARELSRVFERGAETYPALTEIGIYLPPPPGIVDVISHTISERGDVLDSASPKLGSIRSRDQRLRMTAC